jgi:hypothetical protein
LARSNSKTLRRRFFLLSMGLRRVPLDQAMWRLQNRCPGTASLLQRHRFPSFRLHLVAGSAAVLVPRVPCSESGF